MIVEDHVVEKMAARALEDPAVRDEYDRAVSTDPRMKDDAHYRLMWFYRRSPFFDPEVGVYPIFRLTERIGVSTAPSSPGSDR